MNTLSSGKVNWFQRHSFRIGLVSVLVIWTLLLTIHTLSIQHSEHPLIKSPIRKVKEETVSVISKPDNHVKKVNREDPPSKKIPSPDPTINWVKDNPVPVGLMLGLFGACIAIAFGAPILVVTGIGTAVGLAGSYIISR